MSSSKNQLKAVSNQGGRRGFALACYVFAALLIGLFLLHASLPNEYRSYSVVWLIFAVIMVVNGWKVGRRRS